MTSHDKLACPNSMRHTRLGAAQGVQLRDPSFIAILLLTSPCRAVQSVRSEPRNMTQSRTFDRSSSGFPTPHAASRFICAMGLPIVQAAAICALTWQIIHLANREPFAEGATAVFLLLALPSAALVFGSRRTISNAFLIGVALWFLDLADQEKMELLSEHLHLLDISALWSWGLISLAKLYSHLALICAVLAFAYISIYILLRVIEIKCFPYSLQFTGHRRVFLILAAAAIINGIMFFNGNYLRAMSDIYVYNRTKVRAPFMLTFALASGVDVLNAQKDLHIDQAAAQLLQLARNEINAADNRACSNCPDVITIHVESTFDPSILAEYANTPSLTAYLSHRLTSSNGPLRTHVVGGYSLVSEFSFSCGIDHRVFGTAGLFPNLLIRDSIQRCIPGYLRDNGYDTEMLSSAPPSSSHYGDTYKAYGVERYFGPEAFLPHPAGASPQDWWKTMDDKYFVQAAIDELKKPRARPRLLMMLTMWNHGPHGAFRVLDRTIFPGPLDPGLTNSEEVRDYVNRLNESITAFRRLEEYVADSNIPTVIIYYGDHQPNFELKFAPEALKRYGPEELRHITFYRVARNFQSPYLPENGEYLGIDRLFSEGLRIGGIELSSQLKLKDWILSRCANHTAPQCDEMERSAMRSLILK
jgi:phosphoglycerol transferase MdoB-like AlkP superfamily enzyme